MLQYIQSLKNNQKGSATIEFIGVLPLVFMIMLILWQFLISAYAVIVAQSAANEAAKVYSITESRAKAQNSAQKIVSTAGSSIQFRGLSLPPNDDFTATVDVAIDLVFLPKKLFNGKPPSYTFSSDASGKVIH